MLRDQIQPYIAQIVRREMTNRELARILGVHETQVCRLLKQMKVVREPASDRAYSRANQKALVAERKKLRTELANNPNKTLAQAAREANCTVRTIYRYRTKP